MNLGPNHGQVLLGSGSNHGSEPNITIPILQVLPPVLGEELMEVSNHFYYPQHLCSRQKYALEEMAGARR